MLNETNLLNIMSEQEKRELLSRSKTRRFMTGQILFNQGDVADKFYLVKRGQVKLIRVMPSGDEKTFKVFTANGMIAEMAMFMPSQEYPMTAIVEVNCELVVIEKSSLLEIIEKSSALAMNIMSFMGQRIASLINTINTLTQVSADQRLVMYFAQLYVRQKPGYSGIELPFAKKVVANQICVQPETLSRIFKKLKDKNLMQERGKHIVLPNIEKLCQSVDLVPDIFGVKQQMA